MRRHTKSLELSRKTCRRAPTQKGRIIRRRHTRSHLKVWEYFHKKPHIQLSAHSFYENNEWFLYFSLLLCRFYPRQRGSEPLWLSPCYVFDFLLLRKCWRRRRTVVLFSRRRCCLPPSLSVDACLTGATFHALHARLRSARHFLKILLHSCFFVTLSIDNCHSGRV